MVGKILKYDLKWIYKEFILLYWLAAGGGVLTALSAGSNMPIFDTLAGFLRIFTVSMAAVIIVTALKKSWIRMASTMYGDQAYLMRTLPVPISTVFTAKVLASIICLATGLIVSGITILLIYPDFWAFVNEFASAINAPMLIVVILGILAIFIELLCPLMAGFLGITIGYRQRNYHFAWSAVATIVIYLLSSVILIIIEPLAGLWGDENILYLLGKTSNLDGASDPISGLRSFVLVAIAAYAFFSLAYYGIANLILKRGADID